MTPTYPLLTLIISAVLIMHRGKWDEFSRVTIYLLFIWSVVEIILQVVKYIS